tara:strand:- start:587 stop:1441 length:855 start_codon:yes stop_codon:yes gene_type:complete
MNRIIPRLDIKGPNVVKGIHLEGLRVLGSPSSMAKYYYESQADELFFMDVVASLYGRNSLCDIISKTAKEIFIPLTVGGGIRTLKDIRNALNAGADKVCFNTAAIKNPKFIKSAAKTYGSSTIVVAIEAIKGQDGQYLAYTDNGRDHTGVEVFWWAKKVEELGAGEIVITSVEKEGTGTGFDLSLVKKISENASIPVIAHGGAGSINDVVSVISESNITGVCLASCLHYEYIKNNILSNKPQTEGNTNFLNTKKQFQMFPTFTIKQLKDNMKNLGISVREFIYE